MELATYSKPYTLTHRQARGCYLLSGIEGALHEGWLAGDEAVPHAAQVLPLSRALHGHGLPAVESQVLLDGGEYLNQIAIRLQIQERCQP